MNKSPWKTVRLEKVAEIQTGISKSASRKLTDPIEVPYLRVANVQDGHLDLSVIKHISIERKNLERYTLKTGDVLLTEGGDFDKLGRGTVWNNEIESCVHQNHVFSVRTDASVLLPEFLSILTASSYGKRYFISCSKQSTNLASINSTQLKQFPVLLPSLDVQKSIVSASKLWDNAIEKTEALIAAKEKQFEWLLRAQISEPSKGHKWKSKKLNSLVNIKKGKQLNRLNLTKTGLYPAWNGGVTPSGYTDSFNTVANTITISEGGNSCGFVNYCEEPFWCGGHCYALLEVSEQINPRFLFYFLKSQEQKIMRLRVGSGLPNIQKKDIDKFPIFYPDLETQIKVAELLTLANQEISLLKKTLEQYRTQKRGLMQKLLTGEWQVGSSQHLSEETCQELSREGVA